MHHILISSGQRICRGHTAKAKAVNIDEIDTLLRFPEMCSFNSVFNLQCIFNQLILSESKISRHFIQSTSALLVPWIYMKQCTADCSAMILQLFNCFNCFLLHVFLKNVFQFMCTQLNCLSDLVTSTKSIEAN